MNARNITAAESHARQVKFDASTISTIMVGISSAIVENYRQNPAQSHPVAPSQTKSNRINQKFAA
jgi:hypothetical protein